MHTQKVTEYNWSPNLRYGFFGWLSLSALSHWLCKRLNIPPWSTFNHNGKGYNIISKRLRVFSLAYLTSDNRTTLTSLGYILITRTALHGNGGTYKFFNDDKVIHWKGNNPLADLTAAS